jgi:hypothetical protein
VRSKHVSTSRGSVPWKNAEAPEASFNQHAPQTPGVVKVIRARLALRAGLPIAHYSVLILIVVSVIEAFKTIAGIIRDLEKYNEILLVGVLAAAFVPSAAMLFWAGKAIASDLYLPIERVRQYFRTRTRSDHPERQ